MTISNGGTRVRFVDDERLDIIDAERMQTFGEQWAAQNLGMLGLCSGVVGDPPTFTYSTITTRLTIGRCVMAYSEVDPATGAMSTATVVYDPTNPAQPVMAPIVGPLAPDPAVLWARRSEVAAQSETRRKWDTGTGTEVAFATETVYVGVTSAQAAPVGVVPAGTGWFPFAKITSWAGAPLVPTVVPLSIWDGEFQGTNLGNAAVMTPFPYLPTANVVAGTTLSRGLANLLMKVRMSLAQIMDAALGKAWWEPPTIDLETVNGRLIVLDNAAVRAVCQATIDGGGNPVLTAGGNTAFNGGAVTAVVKVAVGIYQFTVVWAADPGSTYTGWANTTDTAPLTAQLVQVSGLATKTVIVHTRDAAGVLTDVAPTKFVSAGIF